MLPHVQHPYTLLLPVVVAQLFDLEGFLAGLLGAFQAALAYIIAAIEFLWQVLQIVAVYLYNLLLATIQFLVSGFQILYRALRHIIVDVIGGHLATLYQDYLRLKDWLEKVLGPIIRIIKRIRAWYDLYVLPIVYRILAMLQRLRMVLQVFKLFHLGWAQKLDAALQAIEGKIIKNVVQVQQRLNQVITLLDLIVDPDLLLNRIRFVGSFVKAFDSLLRVLFGRSFAYIFGIGTGGNPVPDGIGTIGMLRQQMDDARAGVGPLADASRQAAEALRVSLKQAGV